MANAPKALLLGCTVCCMLLRAQCTETAVWLQQQGDCTSYYTARKPLTADEQQPVQANTGSSCPALLWTYTGTGNTMTRMLIEAASGWHTGSVYTDLSLVDILPGEFHCDASVLAVKAHPQWHSFASLSPEGFRPDTPHVPPDAKDICACAYDRAVAVIRDPYSTFLAEYKRLRTHDYDACSHGLSNGQDCKGGHVSVIHTVDFNATDFRLEVMRMATEWAAMFDSYDAFEAAHPEGLLLATFENLTDPSTRTQALVDLLQFLGVPSASPQPLQQDGTCLSEAATAGATCAAAAAAGPILLVGGYDQQRLECAFQLARHPLIYRPKDPQGIDGSHVYGADAQLVCDVWGVVGRRAAAHGYAPFAGTDC